ncbi:efflux RND transporter periplasmic adaptor subunit [Pontibacter burrus]|uniref:Efflux RND transporter periplasmic adaptor subunit n=1 Tax=Pontibacter burrus TaxID=2704466 RepID=A0A6B3LXG4_9BACT|nr:efflux RND transporter periplasmic adaptor subunit [Pontibacter burrus]NEM99026.1 efflux RND transporter periplasmic adaptor subunit [Pontibacter burrus]
MKHILKSGALLLGAGTAAILLNSCDTKPAVATTTPTEFCLSDTLSSMIRVDTASLKEVQSTLHLSGKVTFEDQRVFKIFPMVGGHVVQVKAELGDYVKKGQTLAVIRSGEVADFEEQMISAKTNLLTAQKNLNITQDMYEAGLMPERDLVIAKQEKQNAEAGMKRINEIFSIYSISNGSEYVIKAPAAGFIVEKNVNTDMQVRPDNGDNLFTISDMNEIWVLANVYETDIVKVKVGYEADVTALSYPGKVYKGKIDKIFNVLDPETRVMKVRVRLENTDFELKPEMFANVTVRYPENRTMLSIPTDAVVMDKSRNYVTVFRKRCDIEKREVQLYQTSDKNAYILSGLQEGERVVTDYALLVFQANNSK